MPVNDKPSTPEAFVSEVINNLFSGFGAATGSKPTETPTVDAVAEANRLLKKAETAGPSEAANLLQIADRHIRIIDLALSTQR